MVAPSPRQPRATPGPFASHDAASLGMAQKVGSRGEPLGHVVAREERSQADLGILSWLVAAVSAARIMDNKRASHSSRRRKL